MYYLSNAGGWNKTHGQVEQSRRIDSFEVADLRGTGGLWNGNGFTQAHRVGDDYVLLHLSGGDLRAGLSYSPNGYGGQQTFFLCPECGQRVRFLYLAGRGVLCRKCARLNYKSQQETKGSMVYYEKGIEYAKEHLATPVCSVDGFTFCDWIPERPRYMHREAYRKRLRRFSKYQKHHEARMMSDVLRLIGPAGRAEVYRLMGE